MNRRKFLTATAAGVATALVPGKEVADRSGVLIHIANDAPDMTAATYGFMSKEEVWLQNGMLRDFMEAELISAKIRNAFLLQKELLTVEDTGS